MDVIVVNVVVGVDVLVGAGFGLCIAIFVVTFGLKS